jgi:hypothetical protein
LVSVTVEVPTATQAAVAEVDVIAASDCATVLVTVFGAAIVVLQAKSFDPFVIAPEAMFVTVMFVLPAVVKPLAVNVPVPAVDTVMEAVKPVALGDDLL